MKASDLQVGDLVTNNGDVIKVSAVHTKKIGYHKTKNKLNWLFSGQFEPIALTPKILEKNGFELSRICFNTTKFYESYCGIDNRVTLNNYKEYMNSVNEWHVHIDSEDYSTIANCELTYVHEFQHLLKLCGIDKEIVV